MSATRKKTFPTTIFKASQTFIGCTIEAKSRIVFRLNNCYYYRDLYLPPFHPGSHSELPYSDNNILHSVHSRLWNRGTGEVAYLSAINFQGHFIWQLSCYTLPGGYLLPWPPDCCFDEITPFLVSDEYTLGTFPVY